jgi:hypothetical protein
MESYCRYAQYVKEGLDQYLTCSKSHTYCKYQRLCKTKKKVVHTDGYKKCPFLIAEEESNMANKRNYSKKNEELQKNEDILVEKDAVEKNSAEEIVKEEPKKKEQAIVILATANFYIARKDGNNYKIVEKNNYKQGDIVEL